MAGNDKSSADGFGGPKLVAEKCAAFRVAISDFDLNGLSRRQREVAELRSAGLSLREIGSRLGITSERVRQIQARVEVKARILRRLR